MDPTDLTKNPTSINMKKNMDSNKSVHFARRRKKTLGVTETFLGENVTDDSAAEQGDTSKEQEKDNHEEELNMDTKEDEPGRKKKSHTFQVKGGR